MNGAHVERDFRAPFNMKTRDKLLSVVQGAKDKTPTIVLGVILLAGLFQGVRNFGGSPGIVASQPAGQVTRGQLAGKWELTGIVMDGVEMPTAVRSPWMTLNEDGSYISTPFQKATWYLSDARHLHIVYPGDPLAGGPIELLHEIRSISTDRFAARYSQKGAITPPGARMDYVWSRVAAAEESETSK